MTESAPDPETAAAEMLRRRLAVQKRLGDRKRDSVPVARAIKTFLKDSGAGWMLKHRDLLAAWYEVSGEEIAENTRVASYRAGRLTVDVFSPALRQELASFHREALLEDLRDRLPGAALRDIRFQLAPRPTNSATKKRDETKNG
jgi:hypothetical protein